MRSRKALAALTAAALAVTLAACTGETSSGESNAEGASDTLVLGMTADISGWDTGILPSYQGWYGDAVYDSLVRMESDASLTPGLAESWEFNDDKSAVTLHLREGQTFTDGAPVDAAAVAASLEHIGLKNDRFADLTFDVADDTTLTVAWPSPQPLMETRLQEAKIASPEHLESEDANVFPVGSGPYVYDADGSTSGSIYKFDKRDEYWDAETFPFEKLELRVFDSETAGVNALKTGQIDGVLISPSAYAEATAAGAEVVSMRGVTTRLLLTDHLGETVPALGDVRVRQAMNMVFDRQAMADQLYQGHGEPANQIFRPGSDAYIEDLGEPYPFDIEKAQSLMAEAGYADGFDLQIPTMQGQNHEKLMPYITEQLATINIRVEQVPLSGPDAISNLLSGDYPAPFWQLGNYGVSIQDIVDYVLDDGIWNVSHQPDATIDGLWQQIVTGDEDEVVAAQQEINRYITEQAWFVPMVWPDGFYAYNSKVAVPQVSDYSALHPLLRDFQKN